MLIPLLVSLGCQPQSNNQPQPSDPPQSSDQPQPTNQPQSSNEPESGNKTFDAEVVFGPGPFNLPETRIGLSALSSYRATLILSFDGTQAGQPNQWSKTYVMLATQDPAARQLTIEKSGDISDRAPVFMAEVEGTSYERRGENACLANAIEEGNSLAERMEPALFLTGVIGAEAAGNETVKGVAANHYTFDERALGQGNLIKATGELWVASEGGHIVKYGLTTTGDADYFGEDTEGALTWDYQLTDENKPVTIKLPQDCPPGMVTAPPMPDATHIQNAPGALIFDTASSLTDAAAFYQEQMPTLGWKLDGEPSINEATALINFTQEDKTLSVIITTEAGVTTVRIVAGTVQP